MGSIYSLISREHKPLAQTMFAVLRKRSGMAEIQVVSYRFRTIHASWYLLLPPG